MTETLTPRERVGVLAGLMLTLLLAALDQTIVGTAMPRIIADLKGFDQYPWVTTGYLLSSTLAVPIFAKLSDLYGRKWIYMSGTVLFVAASALCGAAGNVPIPISGMNQLILFRALQGVGGGIIFALSFTVIGDLFPPAERGRYQGLFGSVFGLASVIGPGIGGWITDHYSWRWTFYVNAPVGAVALLVLYLAFPHVNPTRARKVIDYAGIGSLAGGLIPLLIGLTLVNTQGWTSPTVMLLFTVAVVMLTLFVGIEGRAVEPVLPLAMFADRSFRLCVIAVFFIGFGMFGVITYVPLFLQGVQGLSATDSGRLFTPMMIAMIASSTVSGFVMSHTGRYKTLAVSGVIIFACGMGMLTALAHDTSHGRIVLDMIVCGLGLGIAQPIYTLVVQNGAAMGQMGAATAAVTFFRSIGSTLGVALFGTLLLHQYHLRMDPLLATLEGGTRALLDDPLQFAHAHESLRAQVGPEAYASIVSSVEDALTHGLHLVFLGGLAVVLIVVGINFVLPEHPLRRTFEKPAPAEIP